MIDTADFRARNPVTNVCDNSRLNAKNPAASISLLGFYLRNTPGGIRTHDLDCRAVGPALHLLEYRGNAWDVFPASANRLGSAKYLLV